MNDRPTRDRDAIIGVAFRWSLFGFAAIGVVVGGVLLARTVLTSNEERVASEEEIDAPEGTTGPAPEVGDLRMPFTDRTTAWGVDFDRDDGARGGKLLPESIGGGVAIVDLDGD